MADARDWHSITDEIEVQPFVERGVGRVRSGYQQQCIAVGRPMEYRLRGDVAPRSWLVLHDELLAEPFGQRVRYKTRGYVGRATRSKADDDAHRMRRIGLAPRKPKGARKGGRSCHETEKRPAAKFYDVISEISANHWS